MSDKSICGHCNEQLEMARSVDDDGNCDYYSCEKPDCVEKEKLIGEIEEELWHEKETYDELLIKYKKLRGDFGLYADHSPDCPCMFKNRPNRECDCGVMSVHKELREQSKQEVNRVRKQIQLEIKIKEIKEKGK
jgi:hypothetical protein